jgi:uncharacterized protein with PCYCGC motif
MTRSRFLLAAATGLLLVTVTATVTVRAGQHVHESAPAAPKSVAPMKAHVGPVPPLPQVSFSPSRPMPMVQQVYEFAAHHPEVLQYVPCYCGCERVGHNGNHDCFVKSRAANGRVTEWDTHGIGCAICLDVGRDAMMLFNSGNSVTQIRAAIDKKYGTYFPSSTPTPKPPRG